jgi:hypothetical protein
LQTLGAVDSKALKQAMPFARERINEDIAAIRARSGAPATRP